MTTGAWARFDDLRAGTALVFPPVRRVLCATGLDEVVDVLDAVQDAVDGGLWACGFVSYEAAAAFDDRLPGADAAPGGPPLAWFGLCDAPTAAAPVPRPATPVAAVARWTDDWDDNGYTRRVEVVRDHIAAGRAYQVNLTTRLRSQPTGDAATLYATLVHAQRGSHGAFLDLGRHVVAGASPELFFEWSGSSLVTRPMKGTAPRGRTTAEDAERAHALVTSAKERAENVMIVDLLRNDLSRLADTGTVRVERLVDLERYPSVWQLTSEVTAHVPDTTRLVDVFAALFPSGSVTGAPKRSAMRIIRELETAPRGVYCGAVGWVAPGDHDVRARFNVPIRTVVLDRATGSAVYGVGSAITWSSDAAAERAELRAKAAVLDARPDERRLLETMYADPAHGPRHLDRHLARLADSAAWADFTVDRDAAAAAVRQALHDCAGPSTVRVLLSRDGHVEVQVRPFVDAPPGPVRLAIDPEPVDAADPWLQHKSTARAVYDLRAARHPHADDVVLVNTDGLVTETCRATLAVLVEGRWCTPPTACGCLPGVARGLLLDAGRLTVREIGVDELDAAEGLAVISSLRGWRSATLCRPTVTGASRAR